MPHVRENTPPQETRFVVTLERKSMISHVTSSWGLSISASDYDKLKPGFRPECMEDRWVIEVTGPVRDRDGTVSMSVHFSRSWTYMEIYVLHVKQGGSDGVIRIESITWESDQGQAVRGEEKSKKEAVFLCRAFLGCARLRRFRRMVEYGYLGIYHLFGPGLALGGFGWVA